MTLSFEKYTFTENTNYTSVYITVNDMYSALLAVSGLTPSKGTNETIKEADRLMTGIDIDATNIPRKNFNIENAYNLLYPVVNGATLNTSYYDI